MDGIADVILAGGDFRTLDEMNPNAQALSVRDGLVQSVGSLEEVLGHKGRSTRIVDMQGVTIVPGMILEELPKNPTALLGWQDIDLVDAKGDLEGYLSRTVVPPLFSAPVFVRSASAADHAGSLRLLAALDVLCGAAPVLVHFADVDLGIANQAMFRLVDEAADAGRSSTAPFVSNIDSFLSRFASETKHSVLSIRRALERNITAARQSGYTTVVDRAMGALGGCGEVEAAFSILAARSNIRMRSLVHWRLRSEWDGRLPEWIRPDIFSIDAALLDVHQAETDLLTEAKSLSEAGWKLVFSARSRDELHAVLEVCRILRPTPPKRVFRVELGFTAGDADVDRLRQFDIGFSFLSKQARLEPSLPDEDDLLGLPFNIHEATRKAACRCGIDDVTGSIAKGKYADFTLLERTSRGRESFKVAGTWVDGIPAS